MKYYIEFWKRAFDFKGVASRTQYWVAMFANIIILFILGIITLNLGNLGDNSENIYNIITSIYSVLIFIPSISISVRRLHDQNKSGWLYLICLIPLIGGLILFIFMLLGTVKENNRWRMYDIQRGYIKDDIFTEPLSDTARWTYQNYDEK